MQSGKEDQPFWDRRSTLKAIGVSSIVLTPFSPALGQNSTLNFLGRPAEISINQASRLAWFVANFPAVRHGSGAEEYFIITTRDCPYSRQFHADYSRPPEGVTFNYIVLSTVNEPRDLTKTLYAFPTIENFTDYFNGDLIKNPVIDRIGVAIQNTVLEAMSQVENLTLSTPSFVRIDNGIARMWNGYGGRQTARQNTASTESN